MGLAGVSGDLLDDSGVMPHKGRGQILATAEQGLTWKTQEGSWLAESSADAPQTGDASSVLFRSTASDGRGLLSYVTYVQLLGTSGGAPPIEAAPAGRRVQVPYAGRYAFYVADGSTLSTSKTAP
jgi:hypothetical protein